MESPPWASTSSFDTDLPFLVIIFSVVITILAIATWIINIRCRKDAPNRSLHRSSGRPPESDIAQANLYYALDKTFSDLVVITRPWTVQQCLGKGAFGSVYAAKDKNEFEFAVKEVPLGGIEESSLNREVKILSQLSHENIVKYYGFERGEEKSYMFMELMQDSIKDRMKNSGPIPENIAKKYMWDMLKGLMYLHSKRIIHRDIKCANVLLDQYGTAKLADLGISKEHHDATILGQCGYRRGTIFFMSPEVVGFRHSGKRSDIWSLGCTLFEMVTGEPPFARELDPRLVHNPLPLIIEKIKNLEHRNLVTKHEKLTPTLKGFLLEIFVEMDCRPYAEKIGEHKWLAKDPETKNLILRETASKLIGPITFVLKKWPAIIKKATC